MYIDCSKMRSSSSRRLRRGRWKMKKGEKAGPSFLSHYHFVICSFTPDLFLLLLLLLERRRAAAVTAAAAADFHFYSSSSDMPPSSVINWHMLQHIRHQDDSWRTTNDDGQSSLFTSFHDHGLIFTCPNPNNNNNNNMLWFDRWWSNRPGVERKDAKRARRRRCSSNDATRRFHTHSTRDSTYTFNWNCRWKFASECLGLLIPMTDDREFKHKKKPSHHHHDST